MVLLHLDGQDLPNTGKDMKHLSLVLAGLSYTTCIVCTYDCIL